MDTVIFKADISRLVLGYLKRQNLENAARIFRKTSPYLQSAYKNGYITLSSSPCLEEIISDYNKLTNIMDNYFAKLPDSMRSDFIGIKLSEKVKDLLDRALQALESGENFSNAHESAVAGTILKENSHKGRSELKRRRLSLASSSDEQSGCNSTAIRSTKRRRLLETLYLSLEQQKKRRYSSTSTTSDESETGIDNNHILSQLHNETAISWADKPNKESTPRVQHTKSNCLPLTLLEISQTILDSPTFQTKLVDNINQVLQNYTEIVNSNQTLDQVVNEILAATEKDPTFDEIVKEVVDGSLHPNSTSSGVQCNISDFKPANTFDAQQAIGLAPQRVDSTVASTSQQQQMGIAQQMTDMFTVTSMPPRTPLIIRTAVPSANGSLNGDQVPTLPAANASFSSLIDPNFSISKLIVLNSNDSAQKNPQNNQSIGNTTADQILNQLTNGAEAPSLDDQVFFDANTGQLTIPLLLTDEGLLANFPFLLNNETVAQQLQPGNIVDCSGIEIPFPEPIVVPTDQFPPNAIIVTSSQKVTTEEEQLQNQNKQLKTVPIKIESNKSPSSMVLTSNIENSTPLASGIINIKAGRSLSTPQKRSSHVRTLRFSPKLTDSTALADANKCEKLEVLEKPIIKNVEILPCLPTTGDICATESSNSGSVGKSEMDVKDGPHEADVKNKEIVINFSEKKNNSRDKHWDFNIKIPTPQKEKREGFLRSGARKTERAKLESAKTAVERTAVEKNADGVDSNPKTAVTSITPKHVEHYLKRRTENISYLLDTPFKEPISCISLPPTPGLFASSLDKPHSKILASEEVRHSATYLFGSLTKSDLETPQLSARTPGIRFTPFGSRRDATPRNANPTPEYSSGSSYYKPDESDYLDRNIDRLLRQSIHKRHGEKQPIQKESSGLKDAKEWKVQKGSEIEPVLEQTKEAICVEIPAEQLKVEPIVLKRVRSFGTEGVDSADVPELNIHPHYMWVSELPEICADEEESSNSSTTSSSSSSSSSTNSSESSSSTISPDVTEEKEKITDDLNVSGTMNEFRFALENLSEISSTEDDDWQKLNVTADEDSQLVSNDGEVRYPVYSWLTPSKSQSVAEETVKPPATTIKVTLPLQSAEKRNRLEDNLRQKRERMLEKLKYDSFKRNKKQGSVATTSPRGINTGATRKLRATKDTPKLKPASIPTPKAATTAQKTMPEEKKPTIDVLYALNLSAKKKPQNQMAATDAKARVDPLGDIDDNAISTTLLGASSQDIKLKTETLPLKKMLSSVKSQPRRCVQINALPLHKGKKRIVRNPLGFKGTADKISILTKEVTATCTRPVPLIEASAPPIIKTVVIENDDDDSSHISPVPKIIIKPNLGSGQPTTKLGVSPRLKKEQKRI